MCGEAKEGERSTFEAAPGKTGITGENKNFLKKNIKIEE